MEHPYCAHDPTGGVRRTLPRPRPRPRGLDHLLPARLELARRGGRALHPRGRRTAPHDPARPPAVVPRPAPHPAARLRCAVRQPLRPPRQHAGPAAVPRGAPRARGAAHRARLHAPVRARRGHLLRAHLPRVDVLGLDGRPRGRAGPLRGDLSGGGVRRRGRRRPGCRRVGNPSLPRPPARRGVLGRADDDRRHAAAPLRRRLAARPRRVLRRRPAHARLRAGARLPDAAHPRGLRLPGAPLGRRPGRPRARRAPGQRKWFPVRR